MGKKKSKTGQFTLKPWCWYCEREFEDEKVLLQHQKAKHFKCTKCPRKLNTAGGLMVHSQQVHKCEPDKLTNTLPGRDGYEIEIFGMEGVRAKDYADYRAQKESEWGVSVQVMLNNAKRPRTRYLPLSEYDLQTALEKHKKLMSGSKLDPPTAPKPFVPPPFAVPLGGFPPGMPPFAGAPPFPPPGFPPAGFPPPGFPPAGYPAAPAPGFPAAPPPNLQPPFPPAGAPPPAPGVSPAPAATSTPSTVVVQPSKDGVIWPDFEHSPAEKRAQQERYRYTSPEPQTEAAVGQKRKAAADFL